MVCQPLIFSEFSPACLTVFEDCPCRSLRKFSTRGFGKIFDSFVVIFIVEKLGNNRGGKRMIFLYDNK